MINFKNLGFGLTQHLAQNGIILEQLDGVWISNVPDEVINDAIAAYNPWPAEKARKLQEIGDWFSDAVGQLVAGTATIERDSWAVQIHEAYGIRPIAMLASMAAARGIPVEELIEKVKRKAELFATHYGAIQGKRDALEDLVNSFPDAGDHDRLPELWAVSCTV